MKTRAKVLFWLATALVVVWCVLFPFLWLYNIPRIFGMSYQAMFQVLVPQFILSAIALVCVLLAALRKRIAVIGFVLAAALAPVLSLSISNASFGAWPVSAVLLLLAAWRYHVFFATQA